MSYDLAVWTGPAPASDSAALAEYIKRAEVLEEPPEEPPAAELIEYADELLARYPDITTDEGAPSPWADGPLKNNIIGTLFYFAMTYSAAEGAIPFIAERAKARGLVCFDPQSERLLTPTGTTSRGFFRRRS